MLGTIAEDGVLRAVQLTTDLKPGLPSKTNFHSLHVFEHRICPFILTNCQPHNHVSKFVSVTNHIDTRGDPVPEIPSSFSVFLCSFSKNTESLSRNTSLFTF